ncbi:MAG: hypothetical protein ACTSQF_09060 [Candidatus Heimdallarchaeaceae archaeon]
MYEQGDLIYSKKYDVIGTLFEQNRDELTLNVINLTGDDDIIYANIHECVLATAKQVYIAMLEYYFDQIRINSTLIPQSIYGSKLP